MPYDGGSVIGLIILLVEVAVPHANMQPMAYSAPASLLTEAKHQRPVLIRGFLFFAPTPKWGGRQKTSLDYHRANLSYHLLAYAKGCHYMIHINDLTLWATSDYRQIGNAPKVDPSYKCAGLFRLERLVKSAPCMRVQVVAN